MLPGAAASGGSMPASIGFVITREEVEHVALLARLGLTDAEIDRMQAQLSHILETIAQLSDVDTSTIDPTAQVIELENVLRDDQPRQGLTRDASLGNAPLREGPMLRVAEVLEEGR
jgi:aspartyl-tRNA(Asn)/glutamyl-tRNA(Gln) amidotransferase subunit C